MAMAVNVTVSSATGSAGLYDYLRNINLSPPLLTSSTLVRYLDPVTGLWVELVGTGFSFDGSGHLTGGTITEIDVRNTSGVLQQKSVGFSMAGTAFDAAVTTYQQPAHD